jgi:putative intracellular protease/amidase/DNA-directed RNA polymerase subunit RPC12/RpoP
MFKVNIKLLIIFLSIVFLLPILVVTQNASNGASETKPVYVCPPCGDEGDKLTFDKPGSCPVCGMKLVEQSSLRSQASHHEHDMERQNAMKVGIFVFDGVQIIDYAAPWEVFGQAGFQVYSIGQSSNPIITAMGMTVTPNYSFENYPTPDILVIPGGDVPGQPVPKVIQWIQENAKKAQYVLSVCNGAFYLARAGLLDGLEATTFAPLIDGLQAIAPKTKVVKNKRFVDNGKIITSAGLSSGIDASLHVVERIRGRGETQRIATHLEYNWDPDSKYVRASLADQYINAALSGEFPIESDWKWVQTQGGTDHWDAKWLVRAKTTPGALLDAINGVLTTRSKWSKVSGGATESTWKFVDEQGKNWNGKVLVHSVNGQKENFEVSLSIRQG